jgi:hypothetical protein
MEPFVLYCKSYCVDVKRVVRLADTIERFNVDKIPFFVSAPAADLPLFREFLGSRQVQLLADEDIIAANPALTLESIQKLPGNISQQIVKSEFWRLGLSQAYLCLDSDCLFIRPFSKSHFVTAEGIPYSVIDEGRDLLLATLARGKDKIVDDFQRESTEVQRAFGRAGKHYNFGPTPPVWDRRVWESLDEHMLRPTGQTLMDLICQSPHEMRWYGEALLKYKAIDLIPSQPTFKTYHYAWQQQKDRKDGIGVKELAQLYCGVVYQSAWDREMDWPSEGGNWLSHLSRRMRRGLGRM